MAKRPFDLKLGASIVHWYKEAMGLQDWAVELYIQDGLPTWAAGPDEGHVGESQSDRELKRCRVWVSPGRSQADGTDPRRTLIHELVHMNLVDVGMPEDGSEQVEFFVLRLDSMIYLCYLADVGTRK